MADFSIGSHAVELPNIQAVNDLFAEIARYNRQDGITVEVSVTQVIPVTKKFSGTGSGTIKENTKSITTTHTPPETDHTGTFITDNLSLNLTVTEVSYIVLFETYTKD